MLNLFGGFCPRPVFDVATGRNVLSHVDGLIDRREVFFFTAHGTHDVQCMLCEARFSIAPLA